jgi:predicted restriction endonuclease
VGEVAEWSDDFGLGDEGADVKAKQESLVVGNGLLLRSDFHTLFDNGYLTIDTDYRLLVSKRLKEEFSNGRHYYEHHGARVPNLPTRTDLLPSRAAIEWRNGGWAG